MPKFKKARWTVLGVAVVVSGLAAVTAVAAGVLSSSAPATPTPPPPVVRTPIPGAAKGGLFADGVTNLPTVDTSTWKTYTNSAYSFTFKYPADWEWNESDSSNLKGPHGEPAYPLHSAEVQNPKSQQGKKIPGQTCSAAANDCVGPLPNHMRFAVEILPARCNISGDLILDNTVTLADRQGALCAVEYPNDKSRSVAIAFSIGKGVYLVVEVDKGNSVTPSEQAILETILSTFNFSTELAP